MAVGNLCLGHLSVIPREAPLKSRDDTNRGLARLFANNLATVADFANRETHIMGRQTNPRHRTFQDI